MNQNNVKKPFFKKGPFKKREHLINEEITHTEVRITYDETLGENLQSAIVSIQQALQTARDLGVDLVEISATAHPPVCKIIEYSKHVYQLKKKKDNSKGKTSQVKEIRISANIGKNDFDVKVNKAIEFLQDGDKVKLELKFQGREIVVQKQQGQMKMLEFATRVEIYGKAESLPKLEGKKMQMMLAPKAKK